MLEFLRLPSFVVHFNLTVFIKRMPMPLSLSLSATDYLPLLRYP
jgi:hypothetical protein